MSGMIYLYVEGAEGEEPVDSKNDWKLIKVSGYHHAIGTEVSPARPSVGSNALRRGPCRHGEFVVEKELDVASTMLLRFAEASVVIPRVNVFLCANEMNDSKAQLVPFLTFELRDSVIASFEHGSTGGWPTEVVRFRYTSIAWSLDWKDLEDGEDVGKILVDWDGTKNAFGTTAPKKPGD